VGVGDSDRTMAVGVGGAVAMVGLAMAGTGVKVARARAARVVRGPKLGVEPSEWVSPSRLGAGLGGTTPGVEGVERTGSSGGGGQLAG
jgi:hypothetical protein